MTHAPRFAPLQMPFFCRAWIFFGRACCICRIPFVNGSIQVHTEDEMNAAIAKAGDAAAVSDQLKTAGDTPSFAPTFVKALLKRPNIAAILSIPQHEQQHHFSCTPSQK